MLKYNQNTIFVFSFQKYGLEVFVDRKNRNCEEYYIEDFFFSNPTLLLRCSVIHGNLPRVIDLAYVGSVVVQ